MRTPAFFSLSSLVGFGADTYMPQLEAGAKNYLELFNAKKLRQQDAVMCARQLALGHLL